MAIFKTLFGEHQKLKFLETSLKKNVAWKVSVVYTFSMGIPLFPDFEPLTLDLKNEMHPKLSLSPDGVSEYTFGSLFLFRERYRYMVSKLPGKTIIVSGTEPPRTEGENAKKFFMTPCAVPDRRTLEELFKTHDYWKNIAESALIPERECFEGWGIEFAEDRNNFDYLYLRTDLAELSGKKYHKKRNLVSQFIKSYNHEELRLTKELIHDAMDVLEKWRSDKSADGDYSACREALKLFTELNMRGLMLYVDGKPAGLCLGEPIARGRMFVVHFEKGLDCYKGIYQFLNQAFAAALPGYYTHINREQDLGDEGLRQAKMTYRPSGFVRKYTGRIMGGIAK